MRTLKYTPTCSLGRLGRSAVSWVALALSLGMFAPAARAWDAWPCEVALCLANPMGPLAVAQCISPIKRAWKAWAKGKIVPKCIGVDVNGVETGPITATTIDNTVSSPKATCPPFAVYYARKERTAFCAFAGVTEQYVDGLMWGRLWYGGPDGKPYIEVLQEDPFNPRPPDTSREDFAPIKADIQAKADIAAAAWAVSRAAEASARQAETEAAQARSLADRAAAEVASWDAQLPSLLVSSGQAYVDAERAVNELTPRLAAAKAAAEAPGATAEARALYERLLGELLNARWDLDRATNSYRYYLQVQAAMPAMRANAERLADLAQVSEATANTRRAEAAAAYEVMLAADRAAAPLPAYEG